MIATAPPKSIAPTPTWPGTPKPVPAPHPDAPHLARWQKPLATVKSTYDGQTNHQTVYPSPLLMKTTTEWDPIFKKNRNIPTFSDRRFFEVPRSSGIGGLETAIAAARKLTTSKGFDQAIGVLRHPESKARWLAPLGKLPYIAERIYDERIFTMDEEKASVSEVIPVHPDLEAVVAPSRSWHPGAS